MTRICIAGGPKTGKNTLAGALALGGVPMDARFLAHSGPLEVRHTDDLIHLGWSKASAAASRWFDAPGPWIVEGVAVPRALRKWLAAHSTGRPCDVVYWLEEPVCERTPGQIAMANGCGTVWMEVHDELQARGVEIVVGGPAAR